MFMPIGLVPASGEVDDGAGPRVRRALKAKHKTPHLTVAAPGLRPT
jgi:hypothetical protein